MEIIGTSILNKGLNGRSLSGNFGSKPTCTSFKMQHDQHGRHLNKACSNLQETNAWETFLFLGL